MWDYQRITRHASIRKHFVYKDYVLCVCLRCGKTVIDCRHIDKTASAISFNKKQFCLWFIFVIKQCEWNRCFWHRFRTRLNGYEISTCKKMFILFLSWKYVQLWEYTQSVWRREVYDFTGIEWNYVLKLHFPIIIIKFLSFS